MRRAVAVDDPALPLTIAAAHFAACAEELADGTRDVGNATDVSEIVEHLLSGQRNISRALARLSGLVRSGHETGRLAAVPSPDLVALAEVLRAAGSAAGYSAEALAECGPALDVLVHSTDEDTRL
ncbi:hypothetical protein [Amycolatopsis sp. CA-230715]|uniref:hypothetical protein n=1 Tax=Amycolatopsis sp. CA-230715 TaxID=2745196 RepID=UPI001C01E1A9|nr:hypothetical protein [Amycolatopsis sp. CA-230715]QWF82932.1 hypothetical protein HUW46_06371 [Amycolatopsis sp. CA-230715]